MSLREQEQRKRVDIKHQTRWFFREFNKRYLGASALRMLALIMKRHAASLTTGISDFRKEFGFGFRMVVDHLMQLKNLGLIGFEDRKWKTIHPTCRIVYINPDLGECNEQVEQSSGT